MKYALDKKSGPLRVDRILYSAVYYPTCYGFIPRTYYDDGDPLDALVLCRADLVLGVLLRARAIGVMGIRTEKGQDDMIIAVHVDDPFLAEVTDISSLSKAQIAELLRFFKDYKKLEDKEVFVNQPLGREDAMRVIRDAVEWYRPGEKTLRNHEQANCTDAQKTQVAQSHGFQPWDSPPPSPFSRRKSACLHASGS